MDQLEDIPVEYTPAPLWAWNDLVTKEKINQMLVEFTEQGIYQVFVHPRPGMITEYLGDEWWELWEHTLLKGKELEMKIWIYDENSYPSGFGGGHVNVEMPQSYINGAGLEPISLTILKEKDIRNYHLILRKIGNSFADITNGASNYLDKEGEYLAFKIWYYPEDQGRFAGYSYVDLLYKGVTEKFIEVTMRGYERRFSEELGSMIPGIFTDEPNIYTGGAPKTVIRWTPDLFEEFESKYGYELQTYLPSLLENIGDFRNIRHDYYALLLDLFVEIWARPRYEYNESKNLTWTGHYWEHGWPNPRHGADNMAMYAWHQYPGIDMLFNTEATRPDQFGNIRAVKELSSVVNQRGKERALSETYGGSGWDLTFEEMKRFGDWQYALGVNFLNQHLSYMTIKGRRKGDFPQSMSYHTPWWEHYKPLNDYFSRLSLALSSGQQVNRILVIEPTSTTWMHFGPEHDADHIGSQGSIDDYRDAFHDLLIVLEKHQIEYDLGSEFIIKDHGKVNESHFFIGERSYDVIVFPPKFENFETETYALINQYLQNGGKLMHYSEFPGFIDGNMSRKSKTLKERYPDQCLQILDLEDVSAYQNYFGSSFKPSDPVNWDGRVFHHRREFTDGQLLFFVNFDKEAESNIDFLTKGESVSIIDPVSGDIWDYPSSKNKEFLHVTASLAQAGSILFIIHDKKKNGLKKWDPVFSKTITGNLTKEIISEINRIGPNSLTLDYCDVEFADKVFIDTYFYKAQDSIFKHFLGEIYEFNHNPWSIGTQFRSEIIDKYYFEKGTGFTASYPFYLNDDFQPSELKAVVEWAHLYSISVNGIAIQPLEDMWWLDRTFNVFDIVSQLRPGKNVITLQADPMNIHAELEPIYLIGNFHLASFENGWKLIEESDLSVGSWKDQGMPFYSHDVSYAKTVEYQNDKRYFVKLNDWNGTLVHILVNSKKVGIIGWKPFQLEITDYLNPGENSVEVVVTGSLKNQLGPHHNNPAHGLVTPWSFFFAPLHQPHGDQYDLLDYGLLSDYDIIEL